MENTSGFNTDDIRQGSAHTWLRMLCSFLVSPGLACVRVLRHAQFDGGEFSWRSQSPRDLF